MQLRSHLCSKLLQSYMVLVVTLQCYILITKPINYTSILSNRRINCILLATILFSIGFSFIRFYELHVVTTCKDCLGIVIPVQSRTDLGMNLYFNITYNIVLRTIFRGMIPIIGVTVLTQKLFVVSKLHSYS